MLYVPVFLPTSMPIISRIPFTQEGYQKLLDEKVKLLAERPDAVKHLSDARNMGDLSENGYYKAARARLSHIDSRLRHLEKLIRLGRVIPNAVTGSVGFGSTVVISDGTKEYEYTVVGGYESDPAKKTVSYISPLGKTLMNKRAGDTVTVNTPSGQRQFTIRSIR